jgi:nitrate reductase NapE
MEKLKKQELNAFLFITVVLFPFLSVVLIGGFGFAIWISQMFFGPPAA